MSALLAYDENREGGISSRKFVLHELRTGIGQVKLFPSSRPPASGIQKMRRQDFPTTQAAISAPG
jgi:hypothetical protein|tara:strand:- start:277 stop:471 length:195 start_codon:yes stop_codon:yes gene_type:complete